MFHRSRQPAFRLALVYLFKRRPALMSQMDWLADILKNLTISKALVASVFISSVIMYFGPMLAPSDVPGLQKELVPYLFAVMVLTACLLLFWGLAAFWNLTMTSMRSAARALDSSLSEPEVALLFVMAKDPTQPINLDNIDYSKAPGTKLEFHHWTKKLEAKGFAQINEWDDNLISLTHLGRNKALEIQRQAKNGTKA